MVLSIVFGGLKVRGVYVGSVHQYVCHYPVGSRDIIYIFAARFKDMLRMMEANPEVTRPVIDKVFEFQEAKAALAHLESQSHVGKVVIKF